MKSEKNYLLRMENLINNDRLKNSADFTELLSSDVNKVMREYFDYKEQPVLEVVKTGNAYRVTVTLTATAVRAFSSVPPDTAV